MPHFQILVELFFNEARQRRASLFTLGKVGLKENDVTQLPKSQ